MASAPRSQNPHLLHREEKTVSRAELFGNQDDEPTVHSVRGEESVDLLNSLLASSLEYNLRPKKRRRVEVGEEEAQPGPVLFRLVSSELPPAPISLVPHPPRPSICKEVAAEDNEEEAAERTRRAQDIAVDADWVIRASRQHFQSLAKAPYEHQIQGLASPPPPVMIISAVQPPRRTRPSVPASSKLVLDYPYRAGGPLPLEGDGLKAKCCPVASAGEKRPRPKSRRRRKVERERPTPAFWRPNPAWTGKCRGYGYGYPSSFAAVEEWDRDGICYRRDTMHRIRVDN